MVVDGFRWFCRSFLLLVTMQKNDNLTIKTLLVLWKYTSLIVLSIWCSALRNSQFPMNVWKM